MNPAVFGVPAEGSTDSGGPRDVDLGGLPSYLNTWREEGGKMETERVAFLPLSHRTSPFHQKATSTPERDTDHIKREG